jgi:hypothetical protein
VVAPEDPVEDLDLVCIEVEENKVPAVVDSQLKVFLNQAGEAPVVPIIREMGDDNKNSIEYKAAKRQTAA